MVLTARSSSSAVETAHTVIAAGIICYESLKGNKSIVQPRTSVLPRLLELPLLSFYLFLSLESSFAVSCVPVAIYIGDGTI